jgi:hypothetical protein
MAPTQFFHICMDVMVLSNNGGCAEIRACLFSIYHLALCTSYSSLVIKVYTVHNLSPYPSTPPPSTTALSFSTKPYKAPPHLVDPPLSFLYWQPVPELGRSVHGRQARARPAPGVEKTRRRPAAALRRRDGERQRDRGDDAATGDGVEKTRRRLPSGLSVWFVFPLIPLFSPAPIHGHSFYFRSGFVCESMVKCFFFKFRFGVWINVTDLVCLFFPSNISKLSFNCIIMQPCFSWISGQKRKDTFLLLRSPEQKLLELRIFLMLHENVPFKCYINFRELQEFFLVNPSLSSTKIFLLIKDNVSLLDIEQDKFWPW